MTENNEKRQGLTKKGVGVINKDVGIFTFFLFLAFIFWYLNSLGKITEAGIRYKAVYLNIPSEKNTGGQNVILNLSVKGRGSSILKLRLSGNKTPLFIDLSKNSYKHVTGSKNPDYYIVTSLLAKSLALQIGSDLEINSIKPDTLFFTFEKKGTGSETSSGIKGSDQLTKK